VLKSYYLCINYGIIHQVIYRHPLPQSKSIAAADVCLPDIRSLFARHVCPANGQVIAAEDDGMIAAADVSTHIT